MNRNDDPADALPEAMFRDCASVLVAEIERALPGMLDQRSIRATITEGERTWLVDDGDDRGELLGKAEW